MAFVYYPEVKAPHGFETVRCAVCRTYVLVDKNLPRGEVLTKKDIFVCPRCLVASDPLRFRDAKKQNER